jgi:hypothetical protein
MSISTFVLSPPGFNQNTITRFVQSSEPGDIEAGIEAAVAEIVALNNNTITPVNDKYGIAALDLAGGGDGHTFVVQITFTTNLANTLYSLVYGTPPSTLLDQGGNPPQPFHAGAYLASEEEALAIAQQATYDRLRALDPAPGKRFTVFGNAFAGAAKGTRFMGVVIGFSGSV